MSTTSSRRILLTLLIVALVNNRSEADVRLPSIFGNHMVLQRDHANPVWGWAEPDEKVAVAIADQRYATVAGPDGKWRVTLDRLAGQGPFELRVEGQNEIVLNDVLSGDVWICSGQSNMAWSVKQTRDADLELPAARYPNVRLITIPRVGSQEPRDDFKGEWQECSPESVADFSAVGYFFGRQLHQSVGIPIGLIDNAWGGSACEAWLPHELLVKDDRYAPLLKHWEELAATYDYDAEVAKYEARVKKWREENGGSERGRRARRDPPFRKPANRLQGQHRPGNLYYGVLHPTIGFGIRGAIWYQGENNAPRAYQYRHLFPLMVDHWRTVWKQGSFPFYWVQLADFKDESAEPQESAWAELREAQTMAMEKLPNTGQAVIVDLGEADDIHPVNKQDVGLRLARWALARDYGLKIPHESPRFQSFQKDGNKIVVSFRGQREPEAALQTFEGAPATGFAIAGQDQRFVWAQARIVRRNRVEVWSDEVSDPVAVRYAWGDNPVCNLQNRVGLPVTPFRTDDWPGVTVGVKTP
jgi:sialate O-acetylesterase